MHLFFPIGYYANEHLFSISSSSFSCQNFKNLCLRSHGIQERFLSMKFHVFKKKSEYEEALKKSEYKMNIKHEYSTEFSIFWCDFSVSACHCLF